MEELLSGQCYCLKHPCQGLLGTGEGEKARCCIHKSTQAATSPAIHKPSQLMALHRRVEDTADGLTPTDLTCWTDECLDHHTTGMFTDLGAQGFFLFVCFVLLIHHASSNMKLEKFKLLIMCTENKEGDSSQQNTHVLKRRGITQGGPSLDSGKAAAIVTCQGHPTHSKKQGWLKSQVSMSRHQRASGPTRDS